MYEAWLSYNWAPAKSLPLQAQSQRNHSFPDQPTMLSDDIVRMMHSRPKRMSSNYNPALLWPSTTLVRMSAHSNVSCMKKHETSSITDSEAGLNALERHDASFSFGILEMPQKECGPFVEGRNHSTTAVRQKGTADEIKKQVSMHWWLSWATLENLLSSISMASPLAVKEKFASWFMT